MENSTIRLRKSSATSEDLELFSRMESKLYTAVVCDALDEVGFSRQALTEFIRPLAPNIRFAGWARTIAYADTYHVPDDPYGLEIESIDSILPGEVVVVGTAGSTRNAPWGELLSTAAKVRGARGVVCDGLVRDVVKIEQLGFPVFARGVKPVNSKGRGIVIDYNVPIECGGVTVAPGDLMFADQDGVVAIPVACVDDVIRMAEKRASQENESRKLLMTGAFLRDVYNKYGVL